MSARMDEAIKLCRAQELKLTETIRQYRDILHSMKTRVKRSTEAETTTSVRDDDIPLKERQEVELLEQVLEKALKIRSSSAVVTKYQEKAGSKSSACKAPAVKGDKINPQKSSLSSVVKESRQSAGQLKTIDGRGVGATRRVPGKTGPSSRSTIRVKPSGTSCSTLKTTEIDVQRKPCKISSSLESDKVMKPVSLSSSEKRTPHLDQELKIQCDLSAPEEQWVPSPSLPLWQAQRTKKNKLWTKVLTRYSNPVPDRDHFKKRLISTFPTEWASVHMAVMEAQLGVLTQLGLDLTHCYNAELQRHQLGFSPETSTEREYESLLMLAGLEKIMVQVINEAGRLKKDWEKKMAWWSGGLCSLRSRVDWHDSEQPFLPPTIAYSSKGELEDLCTLRLQVAQLKQEIHMHQCMCDTLTDLISCDSSSSGHPSATLLRGVYSLLGEGGAQFPSLILDIDSAQI